jgi:hypothetical protein
MKYRERESYRSSNTTKSRYKDERPRYNVGNTVMMILLKFCTNLNLDLPTRDKEKSKHCASERKDQITFSIQSEEESQLISFQGWSSIREHLSLCRQRLATQGPRV